MCIVSAIITTRNRSNLLKRAIESVLSQTYKDIECIVVNDASSDNTEWICTEHPVKYIYISPAESRGGNYARNLGVKASQGEYCAFLDDDDYWLPTKIEKQVALIEAKKCDLVYCERRYEIVKADDIIYKEQVSSMLNRNGDLSRIILQQIVTTTSCIMVRRKTLLDVGMFDEKLNFWQEYELTIRLAQHTHFYCVPECLIVYRVDAKDKRRLTNKYYEWRKSVEYIYEKHKLLYRKLNFIEWQRVKLNYDNDAIARTAASGLVLRNIWYRFKINTIYLPLRIYSRIVSIR